VTIERFEKIKGSAEGEDPAEEKAVGSAIEATGQSTKCTRLAKNQAQTQLHKKGGRRPGTGGRAD
jgi:hypothetical protein